MAKFKVGQRVWLLRSMRMCIVVEAHETGYVVEVMDSGKRFSVREGEIEAC